MLGIIGIVAMLTVLALSLFITRVATVALVLTGLSEEAARFQARSAFTGTGFTTREAEKVVDHPVRRRIIMTLMTLRSAGVITIIISLILSFGVSAEASGRQARLGWLIFGVVILLVLAKSRWIDRAMRRLIDWALRRWTDLDTRDYFALLKLSGNYRVMELYVDEGDWIADRTLHDCDLPEEGVTVLGLYRDNGDYVGVPKDDTKIFPGDTLLLYGRLKSLRSLGERKAGFQGEKAHEDAKDEQRREMEIQDAQEFEHKSRKVSGKG